MSNTRHGIRDGDGGKTCAINEGVRSNTRHSIFNHYFLDFVFLQIPRCIVN